MRLIIHGAAQEVGRSCIEVVTDQYTRILLDAGLKLSEHGSVFPVNVQGLSEIDGVLISHAHLDHIGALPLFEHQGLDCPIYATKASKGLARLLLEDAYKIGYLNHAELGYFPEDIERVVACTKLMRMREKGRINEVRFDFHHAGHIPGSCIIDLVADGRRLVYTGDINTGTTLLMKDARLPENKVDVLITECTYGDRSHPPRKRTEEEFLRMVKKTVQRGGNALIAAFAVGRAQEILLLLDRQKWNVPISIDGMAVKATKIALDNPSTLRDPKALQLAFRKAKTVHGFKDRRRAAAQGGIFITTSGMLTGGPIMDYIKLCAQDKKSAILLTGYQGENTNGRLLLDEGCVFIDGVRTRVRCAYNQFDFSAHSGLPELKKMIKKLKPKTLVLLHGERKSMESLASWARQQGCRTIIPKLGEKIAC